MRAHEGGMPVTTAPVAVPTPAWQRVAGYDWRTVDVPDLPTWQPTRSVSVVIPAFDCQEKLDLTLAALSRQRYPSHLLEVVVADDGSQRPLRMPDLTPDNTRTIRLQRENEWGRARACHQGALAADGEILLFLDADMITYPEHVAAHARWHHVVQEAVTLGHKLFVDCAGISTQEVIEAADEDRVFELLSHRPHQEHEWVEQLIARTDGLTTYGSKMFMAAVGATVGMRADLYREVGGFRTHLRGGEDMEMGYRLMAAGAVFIPEDQARSWHQGPATYMSRAAEVRRANQPHFSNYIPVPGAFRPWTPGRQYAVPMVDIIVGASGESFEAAKTCVDALLASDQTDMRVQVVCPPPSPDIELLQVQYHADPRVHLRTDVPFSGFPSRFTIFLPECAGLAPETLSTMLDLIERSQVGVLHVSIPGVDPPDQKIVVWRTAALHRARRCAADDEDYLTVAAGLFGERFVDGAEIGVVDLRRTALPQLPIRQPSVAVLLQRLNKSNAELKKVRRRHRHLQARYGALTSTRTRRLAVRIVRRLRPRRE